jgi:hypothetical protein
VLIRKTLFSQCYGSTLQGVFPRLSLLNVSNNKSKEQMAFFSYHNYRLDARLQILHLLVISHQKRIRHRTFEFISYFDRGDIIAKALKEVGFNSIDTVPSLSESFGFDSYSKEEFLWAQK